MTSRKGWFARLLGSRRGASVTGGADAIKSALTPSALSVAVIDGNFTAVDTHCDDTAAEWPDDADQVPDWRIKYEQRAASIGMVLPPIRTLRQHLNAIAKCEAVILAREAASVSVLLDALPGDEAAVRFLAWLRETDRVGTHNNETLSGFYADYCAGENRKPTAENTLRDALKRLPGVSKKQTPYYPAGRQRQRLTEWVIAPEATSIPWPELPLVKSVSRQFPTETERHAMAA